MAGESLIIGDGNWGVKSSSLLGYAVNSGRFVPRDLTFTRATTGTRTNGALLVETTPYNLVQYSEQFNISPWSLINGATIAANTTTAPDGTLTADTLTFNGTAFGQIQQASTRTTGDILTFSLWIKSSSLTSIALYIGNDTSSVAITSSWQRISITKTITSNSATPKIVSSVAGSVDIWGAQLVEGSSALDYLPTTTRLNIPRIDYSTGTAALLLEPQRTNLALFSEQFDDPTWTKGFSSVAANSNTSPSGIANADTFTANGTSATHVVSQNQPLISFTTGTSYAVTFYVKKSTNNFVQIYSFNVTGGQFANFDVNIGIVGSVGTTFGSNPTSSITSVGNGWYRCSMIFTAAATNLSGFGIALVSSSTSARLESNTLSTSVFLWGAQLEVGAYATSYIPTTSASVTRNADTMTRSNIFTEGLITAAGGTWFVNLKNNIPITRDGIESGIYIDSLSGGFTNGINIRNAAAASRVSISKWIAGAGTPLYNTTTDNVKIAIKWNGTTADIFENGVKVVSATSFAITNMEFLQAFGNASARKFISSIMLYPTPLSDAECINITK
jgi:hypothetical protein